MKPGLLALLAAICMSFASRELAAEPKYPSPAGWVTDAAGILSEPEQQSLVADLSAIEKATSAEVAIVTVSSLEGESIERYAVKLFERWGVGKKGKNNGVLLVVAPNDREVRIEVGYGLEPVLPDGVCGSIIRSAILPAFRSGDYAGGIRSGVQQIQARLGMPAGAALPSDEAPQDHSSDTAVLIFLLMFALLAPALFAWLARSRYGRRNRYGSHWDDRDGGFWGGGGFGGGFGGFGGGFSGGGGASGRW